MTDARKRKPADFPAEIIEKPKDIAGGEGVPDSFKEIVKNALPEKTPKKTPAKTPKKDTK